MKWKGMKKREIFIVLGLLLLTVIGATVACYANKKTFRNEFQVKEPGVAVIEKFNPADFWVPGEEKSKEVSFTNTGRQDMLLRFSIEAAWEIPPQGIKRDPNEVVELYWNLGNGDRGGGIPVNFTKLEQDGTDYYYYNGVLKAGESTAHVLESVKFKTNLSNSPDGHENSDFSGSQINLTIKGETVLADQNGEAAESEWNVKPAIGTDGTVVWPSN